ncbi:ABC transporter permease [Demequina sediminicola]|uniref:ABC transporter permease n=1 Tax=Demequina sediminicola TaxID=1095026 RepID=UPI000783E9EE|nr:ABC transporter permease [Demequina sediminicola]
MNAAIRSEIRKISTTRMWWVLLLSLILSVAFLVGTIAFSIAFAEQLGGDEAASLTAGMNPDDVALMVYSLPVSLGYVFPAVLGALSVTQEYRHRTIDTTLLMDPRRGRFIGAKLVSIVPFAVVLGIAAMVTGVGTGAAALALADFPTGLDNSAIWGSIGMGVLALTVWGVVGVGLGTAMPSQVLVVVLLIGWTQLAEPILRLALGFIEPLQGVAAFLPGAAGDAMVGASLYSTMDSGDLLNPWAGFGVLLTYGLVAAAIGWFRMRHRDISV